MTSEVDRMGYFICAKHAIVTFHMEEFPSMKASDGTRIEWFNGQNVLSGASVIEIAGGYGLVLDSTYGVDGTIYCQNLSITVEAGIPSGSIYERLAP